MKVLPFLFVLIFSGSLSAAPIYMSGSNGAQDEMDYTYGAGNWQYSGFDVGQFNVSNDFIFISGQYQHWNEALSFIGANQSVIENWVNTGGNLLFNVWPNEAPFSETEILFGINHTRDLHSPETYNGYVQDLDLLNGTFDNHFYGTHIAHGFLTDTTGNFKDLMLDGYGRSILGGMNVGDGYFMAGALTFEAFGNWNSNGNNQGDVLQLSSNILQYAEAQNSVSVPEPTSLALLGLGLAGIGFTRRKQA